MSNDMHDLHMQDAALLDLAEREVAQRQIYCDCPLQPQRHLLQPDCDPDHELHAEEAVSITPLCTGCNKTPSEIDEYIAIAAMEGMTPDDYVRSEEGTYNRANGHFLCTDCYIKAGQPSAPLPGWVAP